MAFFIINHKFMKQDVTFSHLQMLKQSTKKCNRQLFFEKKILEVFIFFGGEGGRPLKLLQLSWTNWNRAGNDKPGAGYT